ncbi:MAG: DUF2283 domain-containing protein [Pseudomonadota bacterium]
MKLSYDPSVDAAYIRFEEGKFEVTTQRLSEDIAVNYSADGRIVGIEILSASEHLFKNKKEPVVELENLKVA